MRKNSTSQGLHAYLADRTALVDAALKVLLPKDGSLISRAMRYSVFAGGKRLRPMLVLEGSRLCGGTDLQAIPAACAVECVHTYSLIHDDLPAMDNDDLRRGKPTSHKKFGEAAAILAGDALLTEAFNLMMLCADRQGNHPSRVITATVTLASAAGYRGMVGGQAKDTLEAGAWRKKNLRQAQQVLAYIHLNKTAALIQASLLMGAQLAGGTAKQCAALDRYGRNIGLAFQIADDILDLTADKKLLGKRGSDRDNNKLTYPAVYGIDRSRDMAQRLISGAKKALQGFSRDTRILQQLADYMIIRQY